MGSTADAISAILIERDLRRELPGYALEHMDAALAPDATPGHATSLIVAAPNEYRGAVVVLLYRRHAAVDVFRQALDDCWNHDHDVLVATVRSRITLKAMFLRAAFQTSDGSETVRVWRGTSDCPPARARGGLSWTTDRATACWFATTYRKGLGASPLVLQMDALRSAFLYHSDERQEAELVTFDARKFKRTIDGDPAEWNATGQQLETKRRHKGSAC